MSKLPDELVKLRDEFVTNYSPTHDFDLIIEIKDIDGLCEVSLNASKDGFDAGAEAMRAYMQADLESKREDLDRSHLDVLIDEFEKNGKYKNHEQLCEIFKLAKLGTEVRAMQAEMDKLETALQKLRDTIEFGPFFGTEATNCVQEADKALAFHRAWKDKK